MKTNFGKSLIATGLVAALGMNLATTPAFADHGRKNDSRYDNDRRNESPRQDKRTDRNRRAEQPPARNDRNSRGKDNRKVTSKPAVQKKTVVIRKPVQVHKTVVQKTIVRKQVVQAPTVVKVDHRSNGYNRGYQHSYYKPAPTRVIVVPERRRYRNVWVVRNYGHRYHGYGHYRQDQDAYKWIAFSAISVALINNMTEYQQRGYEDAQIRATTAPIGETIRWNDAGAAGTVTATREGTSSTNRYCREFQKTVTIGNRTEQAYGTACMQPDGAWEVISDNNY